MSLSSPYKVREEEANLRDSIPIEMWQIEIYTYFANKDTTNDYLDFCGSTQLVTHTKDLFTTTNATEEERHNYPPFLMEEMHFPESPDQLVVAPEEVEVN